MIKLLCATMQELLCVIGKNRLETIPELLENRHIFNIGEYITDSNNTNDTIEIAKKIIKQEFKLDLFDHRMEIVERTNPVGFYLNWHIDDCAIHKHKTTGGKTNNDPLTDKFSLYHAKELPVFSMIIYFSTIDEDFTGGELEFVDYVFKPRKYDVIIFDSREVHRVRRLRSGVRQNVLVKFFRG